MTLNVSETNEGQKQINYDVLIERKLLCYRPFNMTFEF